MNVTVETKEVTQTTVTITMDEDTAAQLEAVLRLVRHYDKDGKAVENREGLATIYNELASGYDSGIDDNEIVLQKY